MNTSFGSEDVRKDQLFSAWIEYLIALHSTPDFEAFDEIYEGLIRVSGISQNQIRVEMLDGERKACHLKVTPEIAKFSSRLDTMYCILGRNGVRWWPTHIVSIGTVVCDEKQGIHLTINPLLIEADQVLNSQVH